MTELEYKAWCWNNRNGFSDTWQWLDDIDNGIHIFLQRQPITNQVSVQTTLAVGYALGWNGDLDKNGLYFSVLIDNRNPVFGDGLSYAIMTIAESDTIREKFLIPIYLIGCNSARLEFSLTESRNIPDLLRLFVLLQEHKNFEVHLDFAVGDKVFPVYTTINGNLNELGENYSQSAMFQRTQKRLFDYADLIRKSIPLVASYFENIDESNVADRFKEIILQCSNFKITDRKEIFDFDDKNSSEDICHTIFNADKVLALENLIQSHASLFSYGIIELAICRYFVLLSGYAFIDKNLMADVLKNMNVPYFNRMNPKSPLPDKDNDDSKEINEDYFP